MEVYAVFRHGIYRHECGGVFSSFDNAKAAADKLKAGERDDYHYYTVVPFVVDHLSPQEHLVKSSPYNECLQERPELYSTPGKTRRHL